MKIFSFFKKNNLKPMELSTLLCFASSKFCNHYLSYIYIVFFELMYNIFFKSNNELQKIKGDGKFVVLIGGSSGIGFEVGKKLLESGFSIHIIGLNSPNFQDNKKISFTKIDLRKISEIEKKIKTIFTGKKIDLIINNAGYWAGSYEIIDGCESSYNVNCVAPHIITKTLMPFMNENARVVFLSSSASYCATGFIPKNYFLDPLQNYCVGKFGALCQAIYFREIYGLDCVALHPGIVNTNLFQNSLFLRIFGMFFKGFGFAVTTVERAADCVLNAAFYPKNNILNSLDCFFCGDKKGKLPYNLDVDVAIKCGTEIQKMMRRFN